MERLPVFEIFGNSARRAGREAVLAGHDIDFFEGGFDLFALFFPRGCAAFARRVRFH